MEQMKTDIFYDTKIAEYVLFDVFANGLMDYVAMLKPEIRRARARQAASYWKTIDVLEGTLRRFLDTHPYILSIPFDDVLKKIKEDPDGAMGRLRGYRTAMMKRMKGEMN